VRSTYPNPAAAGPSPAPKHEVLRSSIRRHRRFHAVTAAGESGSHDAQRRQHDALRTRSETGRTPLSNRVEQAAFDARTPLVPCRPFDVCSMVQAAGCFAGRRPQRLSAGALANRQSSMRIRPVHAKSRETCRSPRVRMRLPCAGIVVLRSRIAQLMRCRFASLNPSPLPRDNEVGAAPSGDAEQHGPSIRGRIIGTHVGSRHPFACTALGCENVTATAICTRDQ
jgi:hypothetical protein